jgi:RpiB/LacA/LacB family sugar-phosphate isomerase
MKLAVGADHAGFDLKSQIVPWLQASGHEVIDVVAHELDPADDFPDFAEAVGRSLDGGEAERGVMICGSGVGANIASNKVAGIRASLCHDTYTARQGVEHNDMNVICLGGRVIGIETAKEVIAAFVSASYTPEDRFRRRIEKVSAIERGGK